MVDSQITQNEHIVTAFEAELQQVTAHLAEMGGMAEANLAAAIAAIVKRDSGRAEQVIRTDPEIDAMELQVEHEAVRIIALRQPMASDLRDVIAAMRIAGDIERIGDLAKNIAKRALVLNKEAPVIGNFPIDRMGSEVQGQIDRVLLAYANRDAAAAVAVRDYDEHIDELHNSIFRELLTYMMEDPRTISRATHYLFIAKNLERIGDHATNIAETVYYLSTGEVLSDERPKGDVTSASMMTPEE